MQKYILKNIKSSSLIILPPCKIRLRRPFFRKKIVTYILDDKFEFLIHECGEVDTILTSVRWIVGEIRSISISSPVNFSDVSAIMSDSSTGKRIVGDAEGYAAAPYDGAHGVPGSDIRQGD